MTSTGARQFAQNPWKTWSTIFILAVPLGLLDGVHTYFGAVGAGEAASWSRILARTQVFWLIYAALVPLVYLTANRFRIDVQSRSRALVIHFGAALLFAYLHIALTTLLDPLRFYEHVALLPRFLRLVRAFFGLDFLTYWAFVGFAYAFHYRSESRDRELTAAKLHAGLTEARLQALRAQLDPHFLFNTLNTISVLAMKGEREAVIDMLDRLSSLLRHSLDEARPQEVPLARELEFVNEYLEIERIRFSDRLTIERSIAPDAQSVLVPSLILQPLVENAVKHGISARSGPGLIRIRATRDQRLLCLEVTDNGPGFSSTLQRFPERGIGLANTEARLDQLYEGAHRIAYGASVDGGASVTIWIPTTRPNADVGAPPAVGLRA